MGRRDRGDSRDRGRRSPSRGRRGRSPPRRRQRSPTPPRRRSPPRKLSKHEARARNRSPSRRSRSRSRKKVKFEKGMRVEARDNGKAWAPGTVTSVVPLKVKLDSELSGVSWDEVRVMTEEPAKKAAATGIDAVKQKIMEDAQALVQAAKDEALGELKTAVEGVRVLATAETPNIAALKEAKLRVAAAIKGAQEKGVSQEELIEASSNMNAAKIEQEAAKKEEEAAAKEKKENEETSKRKRKREKVEIVFDNPAVGEAAKTAADKAKAEGSALPAIIKAAMEAVLELKIAGPEDLKKIKKLAAATAMEESSSSSSSSSGSSDTEYEREVDADVKAKAKREGIAAAFYFNAKN